jgi:hypothetical protein
MKNKKQWIEFGQSVVGALMLFGLLYLAVVITR